MRVVIDVLVAVVKGKCRASIRVVVGKFVCLEAKISWTVLVWIDECEGSCHLFSLIVAFTCASWGYEFT
jgi:hypothetical protein